MVGIAGATAIVAFALLILPGVLSKASDIPADIFLSAKADNCAVHFGRTCERFGLRRDGAVRSAKQRPIGGGKRASQASADLHETSISKSLDRSSGRNTQNRRS